MSKRLVSGPDDVIQPPATVDVEADRRVVLYRADGAPMYRQIGFRPESTGAAMHKSGKGKKGGRKGY